MNNRTGITLVAYFLFITLIPAALSGCRQKVSAPDATPQSVELPQAEPPVMEPAPEPEQYSGADTSDGDAYRQRESQRLELCQKEIEAMSAIDAQQHKKYKQRFDTIMGGASQYAGLRAQINSDTQDIVDALYNYKTNRLCAEINQALLNSLSDRVESVK